MTAYILRANGEQIGEFYGETEAEALDAYAKDVGYSSYADIAEQFGGRVTATPIDTEALVAAVHRITGHMVFQDTYGDGVALVNNISYATYKDLAALIGKDADDSFAPRGRP